LIIESGEASPHSKTQAPIGALNVGHVFEFGDLSPLSGRDALLREANAERRTSNAERRMAES
jgi:hypothetical protein